MTTTAQYMDSAAKNIADRPRKSERLTDTEWKQYKKLANSFPTQIDAANFFGFNRITLTSIILKGSGHPDSISKIREKLQ